jgi:hypothetical protein
MRDIRQDLQDRINECTIEQEGLQRQIDEIETRKRILRSLLEVEYRRWPDAAHPSNSVTNPANLHDLIQEIMSDGDTWNGSTVAALVRRRGYNFGHGKPGRIVHFTLLGMLKNKLVENIGDGQWRIVKPPDIKDDDEQLAFAANA